VAAMTMRGPSETSTPVFIVPLSGAEMRS